MEGINSTDIKEGLLYLSIHHAERVIYIYIYGTY